MKLDNYSIIFEMIKSQAYLKKTSTAYNGGADSITRLMPYSEEYSEGWTLKEMQRVDFNGRKIGEPIPMKTFLNNFSISINSLKTSITAALGELARLQWIDNIKTQYGKLYAAIYLGKFGLEFRGEVYSPVFQLPEEGNKFGDSFWLVASAPKGNKKGPVTELEARAIMIIDSDATNDEMEKIAMNAIYQPILRKWYKEMQELLDNPTTFNRERREKPHINPNAFKSAFELIRDTGRKNFYIVFKAGFSEKDLVNSAKRGVRGFGDVEPGKIIRASEITESPAGKIRSANSKFFQLDRNTTFMYLPKTENKYMEIGKFNLLTIMGVKGVQNGMMSVEVKNKNSQTFQINIKVHDRIKILKETAKEKKFIEAEVTNVENSKANTRVVIRYI